MWALKNHHFCQKAARRSTLSLSLMFHLESYFYISFNLLSSFRFPCSNMAGVGASVGKSSGFDATQNTTMANRNNGSGAQTAPKDKNLEILEKLPKQVRLIVMGETDGEDLPSTEDVKEAVKAFNTHKRAWNVSPGCTSCNPSANQLQSIYG